MSRGELELGLLLLICLNLIDYVCSIGAVAIAVASLLALDLH